MFASESGHIKTNLVFGRIERKNRSDEGRIGAFVTENTTSGFHSLAKPRTSDSSIESNYLAEAIFQFVSGETRIWNDVVNACHIEIALPHAQRVRRANVRRAKADTIITSKEQQPFYACFIANFFD